MIFFRLTALAAYVASLVTHVAADASGSFIWQPQPHELNNYIRVIELQYAGADNGKLIATWEHWYNNGTGGNYIILESENQGQDWDVLSVVHDAQTGAGHPATHFWQPHIFEFPQQLGKYPAGTLLLVGNILPNNNAELYTWRSTDHGKTWTPIGSIQQGYGQNQNIWEPFLYLDKAGELICVFSDERQNATHSQMLVHIASQDGGDTWGDVVWDVTSSTQADRPGMASVSLMDNGQYLMSYEICGPQNCRIHTKTSADGAEWNYSDLGNIVLTAEGYSPQSTPFNVWDADQKRIVLSALAIRMYNSPGTEPENDLRAVFINDNYGQGQWAWAPAPFSANTPTPGCGPNYSPDLMAVGGGNIRLSVQVSVSSGQSGCAEKTGVFPVGVLPYTSDWSSVGEAGWIDYGGEWSVDGDAYTVATVSNTSLSALAVTGSSRWSNYTIVANVTVTGDNGVAGVTGRTSYISTGLEDFRGYSATINTFTGQLSILRINQGLTSLAAVDVPGLKPGIEYELIFSMDGNSLIAALAGGNLAQDAAVTANDDQWHLGMAGLVCKLGGGRWRNMTITSNDDN